MRFFALLTLATLSAGCLLSSAHAVEQLKLDPEKSKITFVGGKPDGSTHDGGFKKFEVDAKADFEEAKNSSIRVEIDTASLWADNPRLEGHLKNPDFFDIRKYPKAVFESTEIKPAGEGKATIVGKLKLLDKTEQLEFPAEVSHDGDVVTLNAKFKIDRTKWGMNYGREGNQINKDVAVEAVLVFKR